MPDSPAFRDAEVDTLAYPEEWEGTDIPNFKAAGAAEPSSREHGRCRKAMGRYMRLGNEQRKGYEDGALGNDGE